MKKARQKLLGRLAKTLDFPSDIYSGGFRIEMYSESEAVVYGVKGIADYSYEIAELLYKKGKIVFEGKGMSCESYVDGVVCIKGEISSVRFERR